MREKGRKKTKNFHNLLNLKIKIIESEENKFSSQELDFLGVLYALVKMLYLTSHLSLLPPLIRLIGFLFFFLLLFSLSSLSPF